jgi:3-oxoacyl-[acyl-carrier protein] reductase
LYYDLFPGNQMSDLAEKVALVTGGSRGIGAAIAKRLAADGASVAFTYAKDASAASEVVKEIERNGGKAIAIQADATDVKAVEAAVEKTFATYLPLSIQHHARLVSANQHPLPLQGRGSGG